MGKHKTRAEIRQEAKVPIIAAIPDSYTQANVLGFMQDLQEIAPPGFIEKVNPQAMVRIIGAHTVSHTDLDVPINARLRVSSLEIADGETLVIKIDDSSAWMREARCTAINAMQAVTGKRTIVNSDLNDFTRGHAAPSIDLAKVRRQALRGDSEYFKQSATDCIKEWFMDNPDRHGKPMIPRLLGFESLRLVEVAPDAHIPRNFTPYTRAPSVDFKIGLDSKEFDYDPDYYMAS